MCMYYTRTYLLVPCQMFLFDWFHPQEAQASRPVPRCTYILFFRIFLFPGSLHEPTSTLPCWKREERSAGSNLKLVSKIENPFWQNILVELRFCWLHSCEKTNICPTQLKLYKLMATTWCFQPLSISRCFATGILLKLKNVHLSSWLFTNPCHLKINWITKDIQIDCSLHCWKLQLEIENTFDFHHAAEMIDRTGLTGDGHPSQRQIFSPLPEGGVGGCRHKDAKSNGNLTHFEMSVCFNPHTL